MKITITDIAKLAGVSRGTVDRVLNDRGKVAPEKAALIRKIADDHGYVKNVYASNLAQKVIVRVAVVLPESMTDEFWAQTRKGIERTKRFILSYGIEMSYHDFDLSDHKSFSTSLDLAIAERPDAILVAPIFRKEFLHYVQIARQNEIPFVCINSEINDDDILCYIGQHSYNCGQLAGRLFHMSIGMKKSLAVVTLGHSFSNAAHIEEKIKGLEDYNDQNGCQYEIVQMQLEHYEHAHDIDAFVKKELEGRDQLDAIFITNSRTAHLLNANAWIKNEAERLMIIGFDLVSQNIELLQSGHIDILLNQSPERQAYMGMINIFNHFVHRKSIPAKQYIPVDVVFKENYKLYQTPEFDDLELMI